MPNRFIIYHMVNSAQDCPDGFAAAWVVDRWLRQTQAATSIKLVGRCHQIENNRLSFGKTPKHIYVVDYHFPAHTLLEWLNQGHHVTLIDHHLGARDLLETTHQALLAHPNLTLVIDFSESAALLAWRHLWPRREPPAMLRYVSDRDLMHNRLESTNLVHAAYGITGRSFELFDELAAMDTPTFLNYMTPLGARINGPFQRAVGRVVGRHRIGTVGGITNVPYVMTRTNERPLVSDVARELYQMYPHAPFVALRGTSHVWSLRNNPNDPAAPNINELVAAWNPKGHPHAVVIKTNDPKFFQRTNRAVVVP